MSQEAQILLIDDDPLFLGMYEEILSDDGYLVASASDRATALARLRTGRWSAVLLDQKLQGPSGPDSGLDMIDEIRFACPEARVLIISGYATPESVERALSAGAYDFLDKSNALPTILRAKLRNITALQRAQEQARLGTEDLRALFAGARAERDGNRKGKLFEDFVVALFGSIPGLGTVVEQRRRNDIEEIDVIVRNDATQPPWSREGSYFLVECKNWSRAVDRPEYDAFLGKLRRRRGRCSLGFMLAPGGFTSAFREALRRDSQHEPYILSIDAPVIERLIDAPDRVTILSQLHLDATMDPASK